MGFKNLLSVPVASSNLAGHVEVNNEWVSAIVKDKFSDRNFLDASGALAVQVAPAMAGKTRAAVGCSLMRLGPFH